MKWEIEEASRRGIQDKDIRSLSEWIEDPISGPIDPIPDIPMPFRGITTDDDGTLLD